VARLKENLPELFSAAQQRFLSQPPQVVFGYGKDRVEVWDADDFDPWMALRWETVRVLFYRQHKPDGTVVQAYWLTDFPAAEVGPQSLFHMAKSRWEIENQGFNEAKNHHDIEHIRHHHANSLVIAWLVALMALTIERLYRLRATLLGEVGESLRTAQAILGHSDLKTTLNIYTHAIPESQKRALAKVAGLVFPSVPEFSARTENGKLN
jgi:hypothetical protein